MTKKSIVLIFMFCLSACAFQQKAVLSAVQNGRFDVIPRLVEQGKDVNVSDKNGKTPLMLLVEKGQWDKYNQDEIRQFLEIMLLPRQYPELTALEALIKGGANLNAVDGKGQTALMMAAQRGNVLMVRVLLHYKADPKIHDALGYTALAYAENDEIITLLQQAEETGN